MKPAVTTLLLDYGGTLDTNARHWARVLWDGYRRCGVPVTEALFRESYVWGERTLAARPIIAPDDTFLNLLDKKVELETRYLQQHGWHVADEERRAASHAIARWCYAYAGRHVAESRQILQSLTGKYRLLMVTNFYGNMHAVLDDFGLSNLFLTVVESAVVGVRKPDPAIWALGLKAAGVGAGEAVAVGDSMDKDIKPAHQLGMRTVWMQGAGWDDTQPDAHGWADAVIHRIEELPAALAQLSSGL